MTARAYLAALLLVLCVSGVLTIPARLHVGDPYTWREEARSILLEGELSVPAGLALTHGERDQYFVRNSRNGLYYSKYGVMNGLLSSIPLWFELAFTRSLEAWDSDTRRLYLGLYSVALSLLVAWLLFRLACIFGGSPPAAFLFTILSCYGSFLLYYLRAPTTEAPQLLFFLAFLDSVARYRGSGFRSSSYAALAWVWLLCLCLTKIAFLALVPMTTLFFLGGPIWLHGEKVRQLWRPFLRRVAPGCVALLGIVFWVNWVKFGGPLETGYRWARHDLRHVIPLHQIVLNLFFNEQWGLFTHFPLLIPALFGWRAFWRSYRFEAALLLTVFALYAWLIGGLEIWKGEWGYGPRYFLFLLPALSFPCLPLLDRLLAWRPGRGWIAPVSGVVGGGALLVSLQMNLNVIRLDPFFVYYAGPPGCAPAYVTEYFTHAHFGRISGEAWRMRRDLGSLWWIPPLASNCGNTSFVKYAKKLDLWLQRTNFYWFSPRD